MEKKYSEGKNYKVVAFFLPRFFNDEQLLIMKKFTESCREHACKVVFFSSLTELGTDDLLDQGEKRIFEVPEVSCYDAVVLMAELFKSEDVQQVLVEKARAAHVPIFTVDRHVDGGINLAFDYGDAFCEVVEHMVEHHGFRRINFMGGMPDNSFSEERRQVYQDVLEKNWIPYDPDRVYYGQFWEGPTREAMVQMFEDIERGQEMPQAIICANDAMAMTVCKVLQEKGYHVPEDVAVSGFDGIEMEKYNSPRITTAVYNVDGFIETLFELIGADGTEGHETLEEAVSRLVSGGHKEDVIPIYNKMRVGRSCGCDGLETVSSTMEMAYLKSNLHRLIKYQGELNQMVSNYGNSDRLEDAMRGVQEYMYALGYEDFWFCARGEMFEDMEDLYRPESFRTGSKNAADDRRFILHYSHREGKLTGELWKSCRRQELIADRDQVLETVDYMLVLPMHSRGIDLGYSVVTFDIDVFVFDAYAFFAPSFCYLLDLQRSQMHMTKLYLCDLLTGLYNRTGFYQRIQALLESEEERELTIISLDMDGLKGINDTYGHAEGDEALENIGKAILQCIHVDEIASRTGGDEFLIAFAGEHNEVRAGEIMAMIEKWLAEYNQKSGKKYELAASMGAYTDNVKNHTLDYFQKKADELMYAQKHLHKRAKAGGQESR